MWESIYEKGVHISGPGLESLLQHRFLNPPYGYVIGVAVWPVFLSILSGWNVVLQSSSPSFVGAIAGLVIVGGGFVLTIVGSALVLGVTGWNASQDRIRQQIAFLVLSLLLSALLFGLYLSWPTIPYRSELGLSLFVAHELSKIVFLGPATGFAFMLFSLLMLVDRQYRE